MKSKYEQVPGRQEGQVEVLARQNVLDRWGEPDVDFENLTRMVEEQGLSPDKTRIKLYSGRLVGGEGSLKKIALGGRIPLTNTIYSAVGPNGPHVLPHRSDLPKETESGLEDTSTATMSKLVRNVLRASGVRGPDPEKERAMYEQHAGDIQFKHPSPEAA